MHARLRAGDRRALHNLAIPQPACARLVGTPAHAVPRRLAFSVSSRLELAVSVPATCNMALFLSCIGITLMYTSRPRSAFMLTPSARLYQYFPSFTPAT